MKTLKSHIHGELLGQGSTGSVYSIGNRVIKYIDDGAADEPVSPSIRKKDLEAIEKWASVKRGLKVIPYIYNWDGESYEMDKLTTPCPEGNLISTVLNNCLFSEWRKDWTESRIQKAIALVGEKDANFVMNWLDDFTHDYDLILNNPRHKSADVRSANIGRDRKGNIVCFDWFDPYC